jgi:NAD(P)-dependent dehydrogenase (short-subunit alcohol dehydrogenase family)
MKHLSIVTGASRGMGRAIAEHLVAQGHEVLGLSRQAPPAPEGIEQWPCDLAQPLAVAERLRTWLADKDGSAYASVNIINNAALLATPAPLSESDLAALSAAARVGLEAPLVLTAAFLQATRAWPGQRRVLHISSGLGRRAMASAAAYCAVKAGLNHLARAQALEEALQPNGARVCSLAPGVIDTDMQVQLRTAPAEGFADRENFVQMKATGKLDSPAAAAAKVVAFLLKPAFGDDPVADVRQA